MDYGLVKGPALMLGISIRIAALRWLFRLCRGITKHIVEANQITVVGTDRLGLCGIILTKLLECGRIVGGVVHFEIQMYVFTKLLIIS